MISYHTGDIFLDSATCLVNPVNCVGVMGKGLALEFKTRYPDMFAVYKKLCQEQAMQLGRVGFYTDKASGRVICLFPTKHHWRDRSEVAAIDLGLEKFIEYAPKAHVTSVAFPKIGCGLGGLDFELHVKPLLEKHLASSSFDVRVYI